MGKPRRDGTSTSAWRATKGQGAVAANVSYVTESGVVLSAGAGYAQRLGGGAVGTGLPCETGQGKEAAAAATPIPTVPSTAPAAEPAKGTAK